MDALEAEAAKTHATAVFDSSIPARRLYLHRGYAATRTEEWSIEATEGLPVATLVYEVTEKPLTMLTLSTVAASASDYSSGALASPGGIIGWHG